MSEREPITNPRMVELPLQDQNQEKTLYFAGNDRMVFVTPDGILTIENSNIIPPESPIVSFPHNELEQYQVKTAEIPYTTRDGRKEKGTYMAFEDGMGFVTSETVLFVRNADIIPSLGKISARNEQEGKTILTARQTSIINFVAKGYTNKEIGTILGISKHTVKAQLDRAFDRLHVTNRTEAVLEALKNGILY